MIRFEKISLIVVGALVYLSVSALSHQLVTQPRFKAHLIPSKSCTFEAPDFVNNTYQLNKADIRTFSSSFFNPEQTRVIMNNGQYIALNVKFSELQQILSECSMSNN